MCLESIDSTVSRGAARQTPSSDNPLGHSSACYRSVDEHVSKHLACRNHIMSRPRVDNKYHGSQATLAEALAAVDSIHIRALRARLITP